MHPGTTLAIAMWALTGFSLVLVTLRLYTRVCIVKFVGIEDHMYAWSGVFLLCFTVFIQVSVNHGLGLNFWTLTVAQGSDAIFWTYVANSFAITGNAMAKLSMGLFLLRVVQVRWHKLALWVAVIVTVTTSAVWVIMLWNQTDPIRASWDPLRTPGKWHYQIKPLSVGLGVWSSICDFFFAIFPWLFIWALRMPPREKIMLASGMSLGVIAGACGITRTIVLARLDVYNYTLNFVPYFAWAGAEIAVAMICVGVPTLRPLYLRARGKQGTYGSHGRSANGDNLPQFTMLRDKPTILPPKPNTGSDSTSSTPSRLEAGLAKPADIYTRPQTAPQVYNRDFYPEEKTGVNTGNRGGVIWVKNEIRIREDSAEWPLTNKPESFI